MRIRLLTRPEIVALGISLCVVGCQRAPRGEPPRHPNVPAINLANIDPRIVATIEKAQAEIARDPASVRNWASLGAVLMTHKFHAEAVRCFAEAESLQPDQPRWPYLQGVILLTWAPEEALPKLERAAKLAGDTPPAPKLKLAEALLERGQLDKASELLTAVSKAHPDEPQANLGLGRLALAHEKLEDAVGYLESAAQNPQTARAALSLLSATQQRLGHKEAAAEASTRAAALPREPPMIDPFVGEISAMQTGLQSWLTRGDRLFRAGKPREGMALLEQTIAIYPNSAAAWRVLGQARLIEKDYPAGEKALRRAIELAPEESVIHYALGNALALQGRFTEAAGAFRKAIDLWPTYAPSYYHLAQCLEQEGQRVEAIDSYRSATIYDPTFGAAYRQLGSALAATGRFNEAVEALARAVALDPSDQNAATLLREAQQRQEP